MLRIENARENGLDEMIRGMMAARPEEYIRIPSKYSYSLYCKNRADTRVQLLISGGGGYGALFPGFVGQGLADGVCHGNFDSAPNAYAIYELAKTIDKGKGVYLLTNHFAGDFLNNDMAQELLLMEGVRSRVCYVSDDLFSAQGEPKEERGGLCGIGMLIKIASEAARQGMELEKLDSLIQKANSRLRSVTFCLNEQTGRAEFGNGFSGEEAKVTLTYLNAYDVAEKMIGFILDDLKDGMPKGCILTLNRMNRMSYYEGYIMLHCIKEILGAKGIEVHDMAVGEYFDAFENNGCILSILATDEEILSYIRRVKAYDFTI